MVTKVFVCLNCHNEWREKVLSKDEVEEARRTRIVLRSIRCPRCGSLNIKQYN